MHQQVAHQRPHPRPVAGRRTAWSGNLAAVIEPQAQRRRSARCSTTPKRSGGRSNTWRASTPVTGADTRSAPHPPQRPGVCQTTASGSATRARCAPGVPGCLPGRRPSARSAARRSARAGLRSPSEEGGLEELEESWPSRRSSSATRACSVAIRRACSALAPRSSAMTAAWTATVASRSGSGERIAASWAANGHARLPMGQRARLHQRSSQRQLGRGAATGPTGVLATLIAMATRRVSCDPLTAWPSTPQTSGWWVRPCQ
jgi:hypothetical protein